MYLVRVQKYSMKGIKGLILLSLLSIVIGSCFDPPEYNDIPEITFDKILFKEVPGAGTNDSLILYIDFKDGDGDLGLDQDDPFYSQDPYHSSFYFLTTPGCSVSPCDTTKVSTRLVYDTEDVPYVLLNTNGVPGKLVTNKTRNQTGYNYLPTYTTNNCEFYSDDRILVPEAAADASYNIIDTLVDQAKNKYFVIQEPMLYKKNPNHYNIEVKFFVHEGNSGFVEYNWAKFCYEYDGRFPLLSSQSNALEGTLRYGMGNPSYLALFSVKTLRLEIRIKDRALNVSNKISTPQFTLDGIRVQ